MREQMSKALSPHFLFLKMVHLLQLKCQDWPLYTRNKEKSHSVNDKAIKHISFRLIPKKQNSQTRANIMH